MIELVCIGCMDIKRFPDGALYRGASYPDFFGKPLLEWWDYIGHRCETCRAPSPVASPDERLLALAVSQADQGRRTIQEQFEAFHRENPGVYRHLVRLAYDAKARGFQKWGIGSIWEVMRWERAMNVSDPTTDFKLNNNYRSRYARLIMANEPDLEELFDVRELRSA